MIVSLEEEEVSISVRTAMSVYAFESCVMVHGLARPRPRTGAREGGVNVNVGALERGHYHRLHNRIGTLEFNFKRVVKEVEEERKRNRIIEENYKLEVEKNRTLELRFHALEEQQRVIMRHIEVLMDERKERITRPPTNA